MALPLDVQSYAIAVVAFGAIAMLILLVLFFCDNREDEDDVNNAASATPKLAPEVASNSLNQSSEAERSLPACPKEDNQEAEESSLRRRPAAEPVKKVASASGKALDNAATPARAHTSATSAKAAAVTTPTPEAPKPPNALQRRAAEWKDLWLLRKVSVSRLVELYFSDEAATSGRCSAKDLKRAIWRFLDDRPRLVASGCEDGQGRIYELNTGKMLISVRHDVSARLPIRSIHLAPGPRLLTGTWDGRWHEWVAWPDKPARPDEFNRGEKHIGHENQLVGLALSRSQCKIVSACSAGKVLIFRRHCQTVDVEVSDPEDITRLKETLKMGDHSELYLLQDLNLGGKQLLWGDELLKEADFEGKGVRRDLDKLELPAKLRFRFAGCLTNGHPRSWRQMSHDDSIHCLALSAEGAGEFVYSGSRDRTLKKWKLEDASLVHTYSGHSSMVRCLAVNAKYLVSGGDDRTIRVWRKNAPELIRTMIGHVDFVHAVSLCPTFTDRLVSASYDGRVVLWDLTTGQELLEYKHPAAASVAALRLHESMMVTCCSDKQLRVWCTETAKIERQIRHPGSVTAASLL